MTFKQNDCYLENQNVEDLGAGASYNAIFKSLKRSVAYINNEKHVLLLFLYLLFSIPPLISLDEMYMYTL